MSAEIGFFGVVKLKQFLREYAKKTSKKKPNLSPPTEYFWLSVYIVEAKNLHSAGLSGDCDPYCVITLNGEFYRTRTLWNTKEPFWAETFETYVPGSSRGAPFSITVWDSNNLMSDRPIGHFVTLFSEIPRGRGVEHWVSLKGFSTSQFVSGELQVMVIKQNLALGVGSGVFTGVRVIVLQGRNLPSRDSNRLSDPFVKLQLGETKKKTRVATETLNPIWDDIFDFSGVKSNYKLILKVFDWDRLGKNEFMGQCVISLGEIFASKHTQSVFMGWFPLFHPSEDKGENISPRAVSPPSPSSPSSPSPSSPKGSIFHRSASPGRFPSPRKGGERVGSRGIKGELRVRYRVHEEVLLPSENYEPFLSFLLTNQDDFFSLASVVVPQPEILLFFKTVLNIFTFYGSEMALLRQACQVEVDKSEENTLFRGNSICTKMIDHYFKLVGMPYLHRTLRPFINQVYNLKKSCEMDPTRLTKQDPDVEQNKKNLLSLLEGILDDIFSSRDEFPEKLKDVMFLIREKCKDVFKDNNSTPYTCISCFVFLRYFVAAILGPNLFGFTKERPSLMSERALTLVAKTIQSLANFCEFGVKEAFLIPLNPFLEEKMGNMKNYLDELSMPRSRIRDRAQQQKEDELEIQKINPLKELVTLHQLLVDLLPLMSQYIKKQKEKGEKEKDNGNESDQPSITTKEKLLEELKKVLDDLTEKVNDFRNNDLDQEALQTKNFECLY